MKLSCDVIRDLLPLYAAGECSGESFTLVEEHLRDCSACRELLEGLKKEEAEAPAPVVSAGDSAEVLVRTARTVSLRAVGAVVGVAAILLVWMVYLWMKALADQGNYRYFSYSLYEIWGLLFWISAAVPLVWLAVLLLRNIRRRTWKRTWALMLVLIALALGQQFYFYQSRVITHVERAWVEWVSFNGTEVIVRTQGDRLMLETTPLVSNLLETDGTVYLMHYEERIAAPGHYWLTFVYGIEEPGNGGAEQTEN